jgi:hypothetical protein
MRFPESEQAMPTILDCPSCGRRLRVAEEVPGVSFQCPTCGTTFAPNAEQGTEVRPVARRCPYCYESVADVALWCRHCGEALHEERPPWEYRGAVRRDAEPHRGNIVLPLGIVGLIAALLPPPFTLLGLVLSITAWVMAQRDLQRMTMGEMDSRGREPTVTGLLCGRIGTVIGGLWLLTFGWCMMWMFSWIMVL